MAEWENIPRLDPALQDEIDNVQLKHNALVEAVRGYSGGSIAGKTNEVMGTHQDNLGTVATREKSLISAVGQPEPSPSMLLDFASQTYFTGFRDLEQAVDPHKYLDVSRATPKWVMGPQGKLVEVPPDTLAYEYDPVTGEPLGVLIEPATTNRITNSARGNYGNPPASTSATTAPDGTETAVIPVPDDAADRFQQTIPAGTYSSGKVLTISWHEKAINYTGGESSILRPNSHVNLNTVSGGSKNVGDGWTRYWLTFEVVDGNQGALFRYYFGGSLAPGVDNQAAFWGHQLEEGSYPTSYIPTAGAPVTRAADKISRILEDEWNEEQGTLVLEYTPLFEFGYVLASNTGGARHLYRVGSHPPRAYAGASVFYPTEWNVGEVNRSGISISPSKTITSMGGETGVSTGDHTGLLTNPTDIRLFRSFDGTTYNGYFRALSYYPYALTEQELQELTANG